MILKSSIRILISLGLLVSSILVIRSLLNSGSLAYLQQITSDNVLFAALIFMSYRFVSSVLPFVPADGLTFLAIPFAGLWPALILDFIAGTTGALFAYSLGSHYGGRILTLLFGKSISDKLELLMVRQDHEIVVLTAARVVFLGLFSSPACYWAGLEKFKLGNFIFAHLLTYLSLRAPVFWFGKLVLQDGINLIIITAVVAYSITLLLFTNHYVLLEK